MALKFNSSYAKDFLRENDIIGLEGQVKLASDLVDAKTGLGNDFLGWVTLPTDYDKEEFARIKKAAEKIKVIPTFWLLSVSAAHTLAHVPQLSF